MSIEFPETGTALNQFGPTLRKLYESFHGALCAIAGVEDRGQWTREIHELGESEVVRMPPHIKSSMLAWWNFGSNLTHHFDSSFQYQRIATLLYLSALECLAWFSTEFPGIEVSEEQRERVLRELGDLSSLPTSERVLPGKMRLTELLGSERVLVLEGPSWTGKTSIAVELAARYVRRGYHPIALRGRSVRVLPLPISELPFHSEMDISVTGGGGLLERRDLSSLAPRLFEFVTTQMIRGESFVVVLDDPFGHRRFDSRNPLTMLRVAKWLQQAGEPGCMGDLVVVVTTPSKFLDRVREQDVVSRSILHENNRLMDDRYLQHISLDRYEPQELSEVVRLTARSFSAPWAENAVLCEIIADAFRESNLAQATSGGFAGLRRLASRGASVTDDSDILDLVQDAVESWERIRTIDELSDREQRVLTATVVADALQDLYSDYAGYSYLSFGELLARVGVVHLGEDVFAGVRDFIHFEARTDDLADRLEGFPDFLHPSYLEAMELWLSDARPSYLSEMVLSLADEKLMRWEAIFLLCRFASWLSREDALRIYDDLFSRSEQRGFEPEHALLAILSNWPYIAGSELEKYCLSAVKRIYVDFRRTRLTIREIFNNWSVLPDEVRWIPLELVNMGQDKAVRPFWEGENSTAFFSAVACNYRAVRSETQRPRGALDRGVPSDKAVEVFGAMIQYLQSSKGVIVGKRGDGVFNDHGVPHSGQEILTRVAELAVASGGMDEADHMLRSLRPK